MSPKLFWQLVWDSFDEGFKHYLNNYCRAERDRWYYYNMGA